MMKKLLLSLAVLLLPVMAVGEVVKIDGINYRLDKSGATVTKDGSYYDDVVIPEEVIYEGTSYRVTSIDQSAFSDRKLMTSISIPKTISSIGKDAFKDCTGLTAVYIENLTKWCRTTFDNYSSNPLYYAHHLYLNGEEIKDLVITSGVTSIAARAFDGCTGITSVIIPNGVTSIGIGAFERTGITSVVIPNSITTISPYVFYECTALSSVTIPDNVTVIDQWAFFGCTALTSVTLPEGLETIGEYAFTGCTNLKSIVIPNCVTSIDTWAFNGCYGMTSVTIGSGVKSIGNGAFYNSRVLTDVICYAENVPETQKVIFENDVIAKVTLHVPAKSIGLYKQDEHWNGFKSIVALDGETPVTPQCAKPTIAYKNSKLHCSCETEGVKYVYAITSASSGESTDGTINLGTTFTVSVYATREGYLNSETATLTIDMAQVGDITGDGVITIADVTALVNIILGRE